MQISIIDANGNPVNWGRVTQSSVPFSASASIEPTTQYSTTACQASGIITKYTATPFAGCAFVKWQLTAECHYYGSETLATGTHREWDETVTRRKTNATVNPIGYDSADAAAWNTSVAMPPGTNYLDSDGNKIGLSSTAQVTLTQLPQPGQTAHGEGSETVVWTPLTLQAVFSKTEGYCVITTAVSPAGSGTTAGDGGYVNGSSCTVTATANPGYTFSHWTDSTGAIVSQLPQYTFSVTEDESLTAHFDEDSDSSSSEEWEEGPLLYDPATGFLRYDPVTENLRYLRRKKT